MLTKIKKIKNWEMLTKIKKIKNWEMLTKIKKIKNWEIIYSPLIMVLVIIIGYILLDLKTKIEGEHFLGMSQIFYATKVISMIWLISLPMVDYFKWAVKESLSKWALIPFIYLGIAIVVYPLGSILTLYNEGIWNYLLKDNYYFFLHTLLTLFFLSIADYLIVKYLEKEKLSKNQEAISKIKNTINELKKSKVKNNSLIQTHEIDYQNLLIEKFQDSHRLRRYKETFKYADLCILVSLFVTFILYIILYNLAGITIKEKGLYETFFEGALVFSLIISSVIYLMIVQRYGKKSLHNNENG